MVWDGSVQEQSFYKTVSDTKPLGSDPRDELSFDVVQNLLPNILDLELPSRKYGTFTGQKYP